MGWLNNGVGLSKPIDHSSSGIHHSCKTNLPRLQTWAFLCQFFDVLLIVIRQLIGIPEQLLGANCGLTAG
jgi:hypothetical protein